MNPSQLGVIGLGTMGANLARNAARNGAHVVVFNRTTSKTDEFMAAHGSEGNFTAVKSLAELISALKPPRVMLLMVNAGQAVDAVIQDLLPLEAHQQPASPAHLERGDIIIDGGNSHYKDSERREKMLEERGYRFIGMGVSGGEEGALNGPSMMPGGNKEAVDALMPLFKKMAASDTSVSGKCVSYMGPGGAGHFVKMVHNGIEYGDMQLIAETYHLLKQVVGLHNDQLAAVFADWNAHKDLRSFLIEITANIFTKKDDRSDAALVNVILDKAGQKGTGKWTTETALDLGIMIPTITAAVDARIMSAHKAERVMAAKMIESLKLKKPKLNTKQIASALLLSKICSYAQGMSLISKASIEHQWNIPLHEVFRIWKGGCIIRSTLLGTFQKALRKNPELKNLLTDESIFRKFKSKHGAWRKVIASGAVAGVPLPAMSASLAYFDGYFTARLPQNLTQAQRDFFGAHTYERTDGEGVFHSKWQ